MAPRKHISLKKLNCLLKKASKFNRFHSINCHHHIYLNLLSSLCDLSSPAPVLSCRCPSFYPIYLLVLLLSKECSPLFLPCRSHRSSHQYRPHHFSLISDLGARHIFTETLNDIMAKRLLSREKLSEITGVNVTLIDEWLNGTKEPDERQI